MEGFWQGAALVLLTVIISLSLGKQGKDFGTLLTLAACCMVCGLAMTYLGPVVRFIQQLETMAGLDSEMVLVLLKAVGIGIVGQIASMVCDDSGNSALGRSLQLLSGAVILWTSLPLLEALLNLLQEILGEA